MSDSYKDKIVNLSKFSIDDIKKTIQEFSVFKQDKKGSGIEIKKNLNSHETKEGGMIKQDKVGRVDTPEKEALVKERIESYKKEEAAKEAAKKNPRSGKGSIDANKKAPLPKFAKPKILQMHEFIPDYPQTKELDMEQTSNLTNHRVAKGMSKALTRYKQTGNPRSAWEILDNISSSSGSMSNDSTDELLATRKKVNGLLSARGVGGKLKQRALLSKNAIDNVLTQRGIDPNTEPTSFYDPTVISTLSGMLIAFQTLVNERNVLTNIINTVYRLVGADRKAMADKIVENKIRQMKGTKIGAALLAEVTPQLIKYGKHTMLNQLQGVGKIIEHKYLPQLIILIEEHNNYGIERRKLKRSILDNVRNVQMDKINKIAFPPNPVENNNSNSLGFMGSFLNGLKGIFSGRAKSSINIATPVSAVEDNFSNLKMKPVDPHYISSRKMLPTTSNALLTTNGTQLGYYNGKLNQPSLDDGTYPLTGKYLKPGITNLFPHKAYPQNIPTIDFNINASENAHSRATKVDLSTYLFLNNLAKIPKFNDSLSSAVVRIFKQYGYSEQEIANIAASNKSNINADPQQAAIAAAAMIGASLGTSNLALPAILSTINKYNGNLGYTAANSSIINLLKAGKINHGQMTFGAAYVKDALDSISKAIEQNDIINTAIGLNPSKTVSATNQQVASTLTLASSYNDGFMAFRGENWMKAIDSINAAANANITSLAALSYIGNTVLKKPHTQQVSHITSLLDEINNPLARNNNYSELQRLLKNVEKQNLVQITKSIQAEESPFLIQVIDSISPEEQPTATNNMDPMARPTGTPSLSPEVMTSKFMDAGVSGGIDPIAGRKDALDWSVIENDASSVHTDFFSDAFSDIVANEKIFEPKPEPPKGFFSSITSLFKKPKPTNASTPAPSTGTPDVSWDPTWTDMYSTPPNEQYPNTKKGSGKKYGGAVADPLNPPINTSFPTEAKTKINTFVRIINDTYAKLEIRHKYFSNADKSVFSVILNLGFMSNIIDMRTRLKPIIINKSDVPYLRAAAVLCSRTIPPMTLQAIVNTRFILREKTLKPNVNIIRDTKRLAKNVAGNLKKFKTYHDRIMDELKRYRYGGDGNDLPKPPPPGFAPGGRFDGDEPRYPGDRPPMGGDDYYGDFDDSFYDASSGDITTDPTITDESFNNASTIQDEDPSLKPIRQRLDNIIFYNTVTGKLPSGEEAFDPYNGIMPADITVNDLKFPNVPKEYPGIFETEGIAPADLALMFPKPPTEYPGVFETQGLSSQQLSDMFPKVPETSPYEMELDGFNPDQIAQMFPKVPAEIPGKFEVDDFTAQQIMEMFPSPPNYLLPNDIDSDFIIANFPSVPGNDNNNGGGVGSVPGPSIPPLDQGLDIPSTSDVNRLLNEMSISKNNQVLAIEAPAAAPVTQNLPKSDNIRKEIDGESEGMTLPPPTRTTITNDPEDNILNELRSELDSLNVNINQEAVDNVLGTIDEGSELPNLSDGISLNLNEDMQQIVSQLNQDISQLDTISTYYPDTGRIINQVFEADPVLKQTVQELPAIVPINTNTGRIISQQEHNIEHYYAQEAVREFVTEPVMTTVSTPNRIQAIPEPQTFENQTLKRPIEEVNETVATQAPIYPPAITQAGIELAEVMTDDEDEEETWNSKLMAAANKGIGFIKNKLENNAIAVEQALSSLLNKDLTTTDLAIMNDLTFSSNNQNNNINAIVDSLNSLSSSVDTETASTINQITQVVQENGRITVPGPNNMDLSTAMSVANNKNLLQAISPSTAGDNSSGQRDLNSIKESSALYNAESVDKIINGTPATVVNPNTVNNASNATTVITPIKDASIIQDSMITQNELDYQFAINNSIINVNNRLQGDIITPAPPTMNPDGSLTGQNLNYQALPSIPDVANNSATPQDDQIKNPPQSFWQQITNTIANIVKPSRIEKPQVSTITNEEEAMDISMDNVMETNEIINNMHEENVFDNITTAFVNPTIPTGPPPTPTETIASASPSAAAAPVRPAPNAPIDLLDPIKNIIDNKPPRYNLRPLPSRFQPGGYYNKQPNDLPVTDYIKEAVNKKATAEAQALNREMGETISQGMIMPNNRNLPAPLPNNNQKTGVYLGDYGYNHIPNNRYDQLRQELRKQNTDNSKVSSLAGVSKAYVNKSERLKELKKQQANKLNVDNLSAKPIKEINNVAKSVIASAIDTVDDLSKGDGNIVKTNRYEHNLVLRTILQNKAITRAAQHKINKLDREISFKHGMDETVYYDKTTGQEVYRDKKGNLKRYGFGCKKGCDICNHAVTDDLYELDNTHIMCTDCIDKGVYPNRKIIPKNAIHTPIRNSKKWGGSIKQNEELENLSNKETSTKWKDFEKSMNVKLDSRKDLKEHMTKAYVMNGDADEHMLDTLTYSVGLASHYYDHLDEIPPMLMTNIYSGLAKFAQEPKKLRGAGINIDKLNDFQVLKNYIRNNAYDLLTFITQK